MTKENKKINMNKQQKGLKSIVNGTIGESRAKAFLIERFYVLERSVDINGADFLIQERLSAHNIYKEKYIIGRVQVKFFESKKTSQYIPKNYVSDNENQPYNGFFLLCHTGHDDEAKTYFLDAKTITKEFKTNKDNKYILRGSQILQDKYLVKSHKLILDSIEKGLKLLSFKVNRDYLYNYYNIDEYPIDTDYTYPIPNHFGDIQEEFGIMKQKTNEIFFEISNDIEILSEMLKETDGLKFYNLYYKLSDGLLKRNDIQNLCSDEFYYILKSQKDKVETLKNDGLLHDYIKTKDYLINKICNFLLNKTIDTNTVHKIDLIFSVDNFSISEINQQLLNRDKNIQYPICKNIEIGEFSIIYYYGDINTKNKIELFRKIENSMILVKLMDNIHMHKYYIIDKDNDYQII